MSNDETISRRTALKILGVGVGMASAPSVLAQRPHPHTGVEMVSPVDEQTPGKLHFFTPAEMTSITLMSDLIIPADEQSPGAKDAAVPAFIDLMVSEASVETKNLWRNGLAAIDELCNKEFGQHVRNLEVGTTSSSAEVDQQERIPTPKNRRALLRRDKGFDG